MKISHYDADQTLRYAFDDEAGAFKMIVVNPQMVQSSDLAPSIQPINNVVNVEIDTEKLAEVIRQLNSSQKSESTTPIVVKETEIKEVQVPVIVKEVVIEEKEVPFIVEKTIIEKIFVDKPVIVRDVEFKEYEKPVYITEYKNNWLLYGIIMFQFIIIIKLLFLTK